MEIMASGKHGIPKTSRYTPTPCLAIFFKKQESHFLAAMRKGAGIFLLKRAYRLRQRLAASPMK
jgi:hypothetical protein